jgi:DNA-binding IclR family transcriptional regulator
MNSRAGRTPDDGMTIQDLLNLPEEQRRVLNWIQRQTASSLHSIAIFLGQTDEQARGFLEDLQQRGFIRQIPSDEGVLYQVQLKSMRRQHISRQTHGILDMLFDERT